MRRIYHLFFILILYQQNAADYIDECNNPDLDKAEIELYSQLFLRLNSIIRSNIELKTELLDVKEELRQIREQTPPSRELVEIEISVIHIHVMDKRCYCSRGLKNNSQGESNGWRKTFYYPGGGNYRGFWLKSQHHRFGVKETKDNLIYDGQWQRGKRHGWGMMRRRLPNGNMVRIYSGQWLDDMKSGEGKQFYDDGDIYYGYWLNNRRHGLGIHWYNNGNIYVGEWQVDVAHGLGVMFYANGNRYEGCFARGFKNGEGTFYHMHRGQIQKGMWQDDVCKASLVQDEFRSTAQKATPYPIPPVRIDFANEFIKKIFGKYYENSRRPAISSEESKCLKFIRKINK
uniref:MORN repeat-containing protein 3 n=1 Tax=Stomoxys calcitrans TaxID=35570 RepID=A0A1I8P7L3_STOCA